MDASGKRGIALALAVGALGLVAYFGTRGGGRPTVRSVARQVAQRVAPERVELEAADELSVESERTAAPTVAAPEIAEAAPPADIQPLMPPGFTLELEIDPVLDIELDVVIGVWDRDPAEWLRGGRHLRDRRGSLLPEEESDALLAERLIGRKLVQLPGLPYDTPFWITVTPNNFRRGGLEGFPPLYVAHPPVAPGAVPAEPLVMVLSPLGGVRGSLALVGLDRSFEIRETRTRTRAVVDGANGFLLWPLLPGEARVDVFLLEDVEATQLQETVLVEDGRITELEPWEWKEPGVAWSGLVVDDREQPVGGTLTVFSASGERLARIGVHGDTGAFAWRGVSYPRLRLVFGPWDPRSHESNEVWLELPVEQPLRIVAPRRDPAWVRVFLEPEPGSGPPEGSVSWTLVGEGVRRAGYFLERSKGFLLLEHAWEVGRADPPPTSVTTGQQRTPMSVEAGFLPEGRYTLIMHRHASGTVRHVFAVLADSNREHHERVPLPAGEGVTVRGELVLLAREEVQDRGEVLLVLGAPGTSASDFANSSDWPLSMSDTEYLTPGAFEVAGLPAGVLELSFIDAETKHVLGARTVNGEVGEAVDLGRVELTLP